MVVVSHLFLFYGKISGADVTWYESHLPLFGTIYFPIAPFLFDGFIQFLHIAVKTIARRQQQNQMLLIPSIPDITVPSIAPRIKSAIIPK